MKKSDLLSAVVAETGMKPAQVRKVMDATLNAIKKSLESGVDIAAPPLGRVRVVNVGEGEAARTVYRVALMGAPKVAPKTPPPVGGATSASAAKNAKKAGWFGGSR